MKAERGGGGEEAASNRHKLCPDATLPKYQCVTLFVCHCVVVTADGSADLSPVYQRGSQQPSSSSSCNSSSPVASNSIVPNCTQPGGVYGRLMEVHEVEAVLAAG